MLTRVTNLGRAYSLETTRPCVDTLQYHTDGPHHDTAMFGVLEERILLCWLVATLAGGSTFVEINPLVAAAADIWEQARIVFGVGVYAPSVR